MSSEATSNAACPLTWGDTDWVLLADHGAYLPARDTLLVADTHFGKASIFAQAGIPAPAGVLRGTLERIDRMLAASGAGTLIILGDLWHGRLTEDDPARTALAVWRRQRPGLTIRVVLGNHDRGSATAIAALDMEVSVPRSIWARCACSTHRLKSPAGTSWRGMSIPSSACPTWAKSRCACPASTFSRDV
jgi:metallophosphoesterase superfamily enzyme